MSRGLLFWFVIVMVFLSAQETWSQRLTVKERNELKQIKTQIDNAGRQFKAKRFSESVQACERAHERMLQFAAGGRDELIKMVKPEFERLTKAHKLLREAGQEIAPLPSLEEMIASPVVPAISFQEAVAPILVAKCGTCHVNQARGRFSAASFDALEKSTTIAFGIPEDSRLIQVIESGEMPQGGLVVQPEELTILKTWIRQGAKFDGPDRNQNLRQLVTNPAGNPPANATTEIARPTGTETVSFGLHIAPILLENCAQCHMVNNPRGNFSQTTFANLVRGGDSGSPVAAGNSENSIFFQRIGSGEMPPRGKLSDEAIALIKTWIDEGSKFDGLDERSTLVSVASIAKSKAQTHAELMADRKNRSLEQWHLVMDKAEPIQIAGDHFQIMGATHQTHLESVAQMLEKSAPKLRTYLKIRSQEPLIKGNISVFVFEKRYDLSEFSRMISRRELPKGRIGHWDFTVSDAFVSVLLTANQTADEAEVVLIQQIAAAAVASVSTEVPRWLADGMGYWVVAKHSPRHSQVSQWEADALTAAKSIKSLTDLLRGQVADPEAGLAGYQLVKTLKKKSGAFDQLMEKLKAGISFDRAFQETYGATPEAYFSSHW